MINLTNIFQLGWNHQLEMDWLEDDISFRFFFNMEGRLLLVSGSVILKLLKYPPDVYLQYIYLRIFEQVFEILNKPPGV